MVAIQTKPAIDKPGDDHEREADHVSEQVMRMPEPQPQRVRGGRRSGRRTEQSGQEHQRLQPKRLQADNPGQTAVPPIVHEVLRSSGQPLDPATRGFMEPRFGHDFARVRVHTDARAAHSARAIDALAYTAGPHIVFGAGQYAPSTTAGRALLAHELTHVVQRGSGDVIRRQPKARVKKERKRDAWLRELAERPYDAHREWKRLTNMERMAVLSYMANRYGTDFANGFLGFTRHPRRDYQVGQSDEHTPQWFKARGYQLMKTTLGAVRDQVMEYWVHPSGHEIWEVRGGKTDPRAPTVSQPPPPPPPEECPPLADATLSILRDTISTETAAKKDLEDEKSRLERMDKTTDDYRERFDDYIQSLKAMKDRLEDAVDDIELMRKQLEEMKCSTSTIDLELQELLDLQIWADIESGPMGTQFLQPIRIRQPMNTP